MKLHVHKITGVVHRLGLDDEVEVGGEIPAVPGQVLVVRALEEKRVYDVVELVSGRMAHVGKGDVLVGALGRRDALRGFVGRVPQTVQVGDTLHLLNLGGVIGHAVSENKDVGHPLRVEVLGSVLRDGKPINIADAALPPAPADLPIPTVIAVSGTCMNAGKTYAACEIIARLHERGYAVGGLKLTGVAALRDTLNMGDHGAVVTLSFVDAGLPSTAGRSDLGPVAIELMRSAVQAAPQSLDVLVIEMGDGIIGAYGVESILRDPSFQQHVSAHVLCANDLAAAWGGLKWLGERGLGVDVIAGPATDNDVGLDYCRDQLGIAAANARTQPDAFVRHVLAAAFGARGPAAPADGGLPARGAVSGRGAGDTAGAEEVGA